ncbi:MAG: hypothetical protein AAF567_00840 [Actinomycetota bacterium]
MAENEAQTSEQPTETAPTNEPASERSNDPRRRSWARAQLMQPFQNNWLQKILVVAFEVGVIIVGLNRAADAVRDGGTPSDAVGGAMAIIAVTNFIVFFQSDHSESRSAAMRRGIAGSTVLTYFVFLSLVLFSPTLQEITAGVGGEGCSVSMTIEDGTSVMTNECVELTKSLLGRLTWMVTAVVGFYFASSTAEDIANKRNEASSADGG